jgi:hypothetical protein
MNGLTAEIRSPVVILRNGQDKIVARLLVDRQGATCSCPWNPADGKCMHLLLVEQMKGQRLQAEWPAGRGGKTWNWEPSA